ncbi:hypothetical protein PM082_009569 [Marasmius tenuissimus]|nr:hypothetical protein PM082_009569 [Marasmius tenuissimus]
MLKEKHRELEKAILKVKNEDWELNMKQLSKVKRSIREMEKQLHQKELTLGVEGSQKVWHLARTCVITLEQRIC